MLAPPASLAIRRRGSAPRAVSRSTRRGTAVSGNLAGFVASRARLFEGRRMCAMAPAQTSGSCSMIATHDPSPSVTSTASPRSAAQSATLTIRSSITLARLLEHESLARGSEQRLDLPEQQHAAGYQDVGEQGEQALLHPTVEVDDDVPAYDQIVGGRRGRLAGEVVLDHADDPLQLGQR